MVEGPPGHLSVANQPPKAYPGHPVCLNWPPRTSGGALSGFTEFTAGLDWRYSPLHRQPSRCACPYPTLNIFRPPPTWPIPLPASVQPPVARPPRPPDQRPPEECRGDGDGFPGTSPRVRLPPALEIPGTMSKPKGTPRKYQDRVSSWPRILVPGRVGIDCES